MNTVSVSKSSTKPDSLRLMITGLTPNEIYSTRIPHEDIDNVINALQRYKSNLPKPHPHAALMAEFAKDAAETDKPWLRWECRYANDNWYPLTALPQWTLQYSYRRKENL